MEKTPDEYRRIIKKYKIALITAISILLLIVIITNIINGVVNGNKMYYYGFDVGNKSGYDYGFKVGYDTGKILGDFHMIIQKLDLIM